MIAAAAVEIHALWEIARSPRMEITPALVSLGGSVRCTPPNVSLLSDPPNTAASLSCSILLLSAVLRRLVGHYHFLENCARSVVVNTIS
jgi:hypothetical protein